MRDLTGEATDTGTKKMIDTTAKDGTMNTGEMTADQTTTDMTELYLHMINTNECQENDKGHMIPTTGDTEQVR